MVKPMEAGFFAARLLRALKMLMCLEEVSDVNTLKVSLQSYLIWFWTYLLGLMFQKSLLRRETLLLRGLGSQKEGLAM